MDVTLRVDPPGGMVAMQVTVSLDEWSYSEEENRDILGAVIDKAVAKVKAAYGIEVA